MARLVLLSLVLAGSIASAQSGGPTSVESLGGMGWTVGSQSAGDLNSWEGGDLRAPVIEEGPKRRPGPAVLADVRVEVAANLEPSVREWLQGALQGQGTAREVQFVELKRDRSVRRVVTYPASKIVEIQLPALDAASEVRAFIALKFSASSSTESMQAPAAALGSSGDPHSHIEKRGFVLSIDGIQAQGISKVSSITAKIGSDGVPRISNILVTLTGVDPAQAGWKAWFDSYVVQGKNTDADEKSGTLVLSTAAGPAISFGLKGLGIVRVTRTGLHDLNGQSSAIQHEIELTCEGLSLAAGDATPAPVPVAPEPVKPAPPVPAAAEDQGARDPAGVPRFKECVRTSFTGVRGKTQNEESATYVTQASIEDVEAFLSGKMKELNWTEGSRIETGRLADQSYKLDIRWEHEKQQAAVLILRKRKDGATSIEWLVTTQIK